MSDSDSHHGKNEIIIIKRHGGDHGGHHGGAWKIAYADFMTAMMAFFLVMWLINAANEETKASVASYFNPIKLTDEKPAEKGLKQPAKEAEGEDNQEKSKTDGEESQSGGSAETGKDLTSTSGEESKYSEADFFENPYSVLSEIAQEVGQQANISVKGDGGASLAGPATGASGGEAYRDPFDPDFWTKQVEVSNAEANSIAKAAENTPSDEQAAADDAADMKPVAENDEAVIPEKKTGKVDPVKDALEAAKQADSKPDDAKEIAASASTEANAEALKSEIAKEISGVAGKLAEGLVVTPAEGGLLISISDQSDAPMFNVGSALPKQDLVLAMEKIGKLLSERKGAVAIRGHTDARPFKDGSSDNWQLSTSRAESAYYMLLRGGLDESRVSQVSGFADRRLQVPDDPMAAANRRIEILVQSDKG